LKGRDRNKLIGIAENSVKRCEQKEAAKAPAIKTGSRRESTGDNHLREVNE